MVDPRKIRLKRGVKGLASRNERVVLDRAMRRVLSASGDGGSASPSRTAEETSGRQLYFLCKCGQWAAAHAMLDRYNPQISANPPVFRDSLIWV